MLEAKKIPSLRFPEYTGEYNIKELGRIADVTKLAGYEYTKHVVYSEEGKIIGLRALNIKNNVITLDDVQYIDGSDFTKLGRSKLFIGDLLFTYIGAYIGDIAIVPENDKFYLAPNISRIRCDPKFVHFQYVFQNMRRVAFLMKEVKKFIASSSQPALSMESIRKFKITFPTLHEQQKIASFLTVVDTKIEQLTQKNTLHKQYKKGVMEKIFSQEIRFKDENGKDYPDWEEKMLGDLMDYEQPTNYLVSNTEYDDTYDTPVLTAGKTFLLGYTDEKEGVYSEGLPVIIFDDFTTATQFVDFPFKAKSSAMKILKPKEEVNIKFAFEAMQIIRFEVGGHGRHWISKYSNLLISVPCPEEQIQIANFLSSIDEKIKLVDSQLEKTKEFKKGLLQQMFV